MAVYSSILAWEIPWTEEPKRLQSKGSQRVRHDSMHTTQILVITKKKLQIIQKHTAGEDSSLHHRTASLSYPIPISLWRRPLSPFGILSLLFFSVFQHTLPLNTQSMETSDKKRTRKNEKFRNHPLTNLVSMFWTKEKNHSLEVTYLKVYICF